MSLKSDRQQCKHRQTGRHMSHMWSFLRLTELHTPSIMTTSGSVKTALANEFSDVNHIFWKKTKTPFFLRIGRYLSICYLSRLKQDFCVRVCVR